MTVPPLGSLVQAEGKPVSLTLQARDQCEQGYQGSEGHAVLDSTDPAVDCPEVVQVEQADDGYVTDSTVSFETPGPQYLPLTMAAGQRRFVSNLVWVKTA